MPQDWDVLGNLSSKNKQKGIQWRALLAKSHPGAPLGDNKGRKIWYWCPGDICPEVYQMPQDWDVLGELPPLNSKTLDSGRLWRFPVTNYFDLLLSCKEAAVSSPFGKNSISP